jgi:HlyD family secretion protein
MKRALLFTLIALVIVCGAGGIALFGKFGRQSKDEVAQAKVTRGELSVKVIETGTIDAVKAVEVRSRASGRLARLLVEEGDFVTEGQLIAVIDPQETQFRVEQDAAQLRGAQSAVARTSVEIEQRRATSQAALKQAELRLAQLREELKAQPTLTKSAIAQAQAALAAARQERERLVSSAHPNRRTLERQAVDEAAAQQDNAQKEYARIQDLERKGYVAGRALENARLTLDLAKVRMRAAQESRDRLEAALRLELAKADEDIKRAQADLDRALANEIQDVVKRKEFESAQAAVAQARAALKDVEVLRQSREQSRATVAQLGSALRDSRRQLGETQIRAPMSGVVTKRYLEVGELVTALSAFSAGTSIVRIEDRRSMQVNLQVNEIDVARLAKGMLATIEVDAIPGKTLAGRVTKIAPASIALAAQSGQPGAGQSADAVVKYEVEIVLNETDPRLRSGMSAKCTLEVIRRDQVLLLPVEFVGKDEKGRFVMLAPADKQGKAVRQPVQVGASSGASIEILEGVKEGERVVRPEYKGPPRQGFMQFGPDDEGEDGAEGKGEKK